MFHHAFRPMKRISFVLFLLMITFAVSAQQDPKAKAAFEKAVSIIRHSSVKMTFTTVVEMPTTKKRETVSGTLWMKGAKFKLIMDGMTSYFDGKTEWVYQPENKEVTIASISSKEQQAINPLAILSNYEGKSVKIIFDSTVKSVATSETIDLFPTNLSANEFKIELRLDKQTNYPQAITIFSRDGTRTYITLHAFQVVPTLNDDAFVFNLKAHPRISVNDLR
jgi:outer membrane lipoprotein-sorting protein